jgi:hypothetical protein
MFDCTFSFEFENPEKKKLNAKTDMMLLIDEIDYNDVCPDRHDR